MKITALEFSADYPQPPYGNVQYPHCDQWILHSPGVCIYCDTHEDWQRDRIRWAVAFSDTPDDEVKAKSLTPCPSTLRRSAEVRDRWGGNTPS